MNYLPISILTLILASSCSHNTASKVPMRSPDTMVVLNAPTLASSFHFKNEAMRLSNDFRRKHGLPALRHNSKLETAAQKHSSVMAKHGYLGHHQPGNSSRPMKRTEKAGYKPYIVAENVFGPNMRMSAIDHATLTPKRAVDGWIGSAGHRRNLLDPRIKEVGYGYVDGFWTQLLAAPDKYSSRPAGPSKPRRKRVSPMRKPAPVPFNYRNL